MKRQYCQEEREPRERSRLEALQLERLKKTIRQAIQSPFYKEVFEKNGLTPDSIRTLEDLRKIPFTIKAPAKETHISQEYHEVIYHEICIRVEEHFFKENR